MAVRGERLSRREFSSGVYLRRLRRQINTYTFAKGLRLTTILGSMCLTMCLSICPPAWAAQLSQTNAADSRSAIVLTGDITSGDSHRFFHYIKDNFVKKRRSLTAVYLDSSGGLLEEGRKIAEIVHRLDVAVVVSDSAVCRSACFLILAASSQRIIGVHAKLGVHSVAADPDSIGGKTGEDSSAMAKTVELARLYYAYGLPDSIVVKMLTTLPNSLYSLNDSEKAQLREGGVP